MKRVAGLFFFVSLLSVTYGQRVVSLLEKADSIYFANPDSSYSLCKLAQSLAQKNSDGKTNADACLCKSRYYILKTRYNEADRDLKTAADFFRKSGDKLKLANACNLRSIWLERKGDTAASYDYQNEAIRLYKEAGSVQGLATTLMNLANMYILNKRFSKAEELLKEMEGLLDRLPQSYAYFYNQNKGMVLLFTGNLKAAQKYLREALKITRDQRMVDSEITCMTLIGQALFKEGKHHEAIQTLNQAEALAVNQQLDFELMEIYNQLEVAYFETKQETLLAEVRSKQAELIASKEKNEDAEEDLLRKKVEEKKMELRKKYEELKQERNDQPRRMLLYAAAGGILLALVILILIRKNQKKQNQA